MSFAVSEHVQNDRLILKDTDTIKLGLNGRFHTKTVIDHEAKELFVTDRRRYVELQIAKFAENARNSKVAKHLMANVI